ncbi:MAG: CoxG family protein [Anaerolineales bacterium]
MKFEGTVTIDAPIDRVWQHLTDPHVISECIPGLESLEIITPGKEFKAVAAVGLGNMRVIFNTTAEWLDLQPPHHAKMKAHGTAPGSATDVVSEMHLKNAPDNTTELEWTADVVIVGKIASTAARLMGGVTKKLTSLFFECVKDKIEGGNSTD